MEESEGIWVPLSFFYHGFGRGKQGNEIFRYVVACVGVVIIEVDLQNGIKMSIDKLQISTKMIIYEDA